MARGGSLREATLPAAYEPYDARARQCTFYHLLAGESPHASNYPTKYKDSYVHTQCISFVYPNAARSPQPAAIASPRRAPSPRTPSTHPAPNTPSTPSTRRSTARATRD